ncbi:hypothetical protein ACQ4PT_029997 [Festuca glaucescens]
MEMLMEMRKEARENHESLRVEIHDNRVVFDEWKPQMEKQVEQLQEAVRDLQVQLQGSSPGTMETSFRPGESLNCDTPSAPPAPGKFVPSWRRANSPDGCRDDLTARGPRPGVVTTVAPPAKGLATWENETELKAKFLVAAAWGQAAFEGRENVTNRKTRKWRQRRDHTAGKRHETARLAAREKSQEEALVTKKRSERLIKPNPRFYGDDWTK